MNKIEKIIEVWNTLETEVSLVDLVDAISRKYHIINDVQLLYAVKSTMEANKHLFNREVKSPQAIIENDLSKVVTFDKFEVAYSRFLEQADRNAITQKSEGSKTPEGFVFEPKQNFICGGAFSQHFGQGAASKTPYMNWHVVSVYYVVDSKKIVLGIEESRYLHLKEMEPIRTEAIGKKDRNVAIFYECFKSNIDYNELYRKFMEVSQRVIELGLK